MEFFFFVDLPSQAERADVLPVYGHFLRIVERLFHCLDRADRGNGEWRRILFALQKQHVAGTAHCGIEQHTLVHDHHGFRAARPKRVHHGFDVLLVHHVIVDVGGGAAGIDHVFPEWRIVERHHESGAFHRGQHGAVAGAFAVLLVGVVLAVQGFAQIVHAGAERVDFRLQGVDFFHALFHEFGGVVGHHDGTVHAQVRGEQESGEHEHKECRHSGRFRPFRGVLAGVLRHADLPDSH